jgi:hypothetical protein
MDEEENELLLDIVEEGTYVEGNSRFNKDLEHKLLKMRSWSLTGVPTHGSQLPNLCVCVLLLN